MYEVTVIGKQALKDQYMKEKLKAGDMRGMTSKSRFEYGEKLGISSLEIYFHSTAQKKGKVEIEADISYDGRSAGSVYNWNDLWQDIKDETREIEIQFTKVEWNKAGTDADRRSVGPNIIFKHK